ncbi:MAG: helix-turn-helix domain-containing protein [Saprospiraceae bacterium]|nr:helix-turn-helix domain-containing protein [Saprospiraceae bacterium]
MIDRLKKIIAENGLTSSKFADEIDVQRSSISHILSGRNKPSLEFVQKILKRFPEINSEWLLSGNGKMKSIDNSNLFTQEEIAKNDKMVPPEIKTEIKKEVKIIEPSEEKFSNIITQKIDSSQKKTSKSKTIERVIIFYNDKTFETYNQGLEGE